MKRAMPSVPSAPDPAAWNFDLCPDDELPLCLYYEGAREVSVVKEYMGSETYKRSPKPISCSSLGSKYIAFTCPEFPQTPWLGIDKAKRRAYLRDAKQADDARCGPTELVIPNHLMHEFVGKLAGLIETSMLYINDEGETAKIGICPMPERETTWVAMRLDSSKSKADLEKEFGKFLETLPDSDFDRPSNRGKARDRLRQLTAKRLRDFCVQNGIPSSLDAALHMWQNATPKGVYYADVSSASRAIRSIERFLAGLYQLVASTPDFFDGTDRGAVLSVQDI